MAGVEHDRRRRQRLSTRQNRLRPTRRADPPAGPLRAQHRNDHAEWRQAAAVAAVLLLAACSAGSGESTASRRNPPPASTAHPATPATAPPRPGPPALVVDRGDPNRRIVALTFDAGADTGFTSQILDTLGRGGIRATFGITGQWAQQNPDLVRRMAIEGYQIVNHTYDHRSFTGNSSRTSPLSEAERREEIQRTEEVIFGLTGQTTRPWFRPPFGDYDASVNTVLGATGYRYNAMWTVDALGWMRISAAEITERCLGRMEPGAIYLFHVGSQSQDATALPGIIDGLRQAGYSFGTLSEVTGLQ